MNTDIVIVGTGFAGSIMAYLLANDNKRVKICERRNHIAGNMYDFVDEYGIRIQKYGPHTFHTNNKEVYDFISKFCVMENYRLKCEAIIDGEPTPSPFNFKTIEQFYDEESAQKLKNKLLNYYGKESATVLQMLNCEDDDIREYAEFLFKKDYSLYTAKQWGKKPEEIDPSVLERVPVVFNYNDTYFYDDYEGIPQNGFTSLFENMLNHENIEICLNMDALEYISFDDEKHKILFDGKDIPVIFTGPIDELFNNEFGNLPYRSLYFEYEYHPMESYQNVAIVAHPADEEYTRITEYTKLPFQNIDKKTVIAKEYSVEYNKNNVQGNEPYYPILTEDSKMRYEKYLSLSKKYDNLYLCGRLADFKYYNMDQVIDRILKYYKEIKNSI